MKTTFFKVFGGEIELHVKKMKLFFIIFFVPNRVLIQMGAKTDQNTGNWYGQWKIVQKQHFFHFIS